MELQDFSVLYLLLSFLCTLLKEGNCVHTKMKSQEEKLIGLVFSKSRDKQGEKRGRRVPGPLKKVPGLLDFFGPGTMRPQDLQGL